MLGLFCSYYSIKSLPDDKIIDLPKLKALTDDKLNVAQMLELFFNRLENILGKGENANNQHFLFSQNVYKGHSPSGSLNLGIVW